MENFGKRAGKAAGQIVIAVIAAGVCAVGATYVALKSKKFANEAIEGIGQMGNIVGCQVDDWKNGKDED